MKTLVMFQVVQKVLPKHFQSERFPQKGSPRFSKRFCQNTSSPKGSPKRGPSLLLAISLFISPIFGRSLSDCHFRRPLTFRSILLFNILVHNCPKPVSFDIYPVFPTWYCGPFPGLVLPQVLHIFPAWNVNFLIGVTVLHGFQL